MTPDDYQYRALATALPAALDAVYLTLGLCGESGEVAELLKKSIRDGEKADHADRLRRELGDVLWYVAVLAHVHGLTLEEVMQANLDKLATRKATGNLGGSGDYRGEVDDRARLEARVRALEAEVVEARAERDQWAAELDALRAGGAQ